MYKSVIFMIPNSTCCHLNVQLQFKTKRTVSISLNCHLPFAVSFVISTFDFANISLVCKHSSEINLFKLFAKGGANTLHFWIFSPFRIFAKEMYSD